MFFFFCINNKNIVINVAIFFRYQWKFSVKKYYFCRCLNKMNTSHRLKRTCSVQMFQRFYKFYYFGTNRWLIRMKYMSMLMNGIVSIVYIQRKYIHTFQEKLFRLGLLIALFLRSVCWCIEPYFHGREISFFIVFGFWNYTIYII